MLKKITSVSFVLSALFLSVTQSVSAQTMCPTGRFASLCNLKLQGNNASTLIGGIITILLIIAMIVALFFIIYGGIRWTMSGGDKGKIDQARQTITAAVVGLIIALLAFFIVSIVSYALTGQAGWVFTIPTLVP